MDSGIPCILSCTSRPIALYSDVSGRHVTPLGAAFRMAAAVVSPFIGSVSIAICDHAASTRLNRLSFSRIQAKRALFIGSTVPVSADRSTNREIFLILLNPSNKGEFICRTCYIT